ncbi:hypothetical protein ELI50_19100 [Rhizobium leguminosarum]|nr:hypothetical protein ELI50_19100 [Rhizobium leguminosarum]
MTRISLPDKSAWPSVGHCYRRAVDAQSLEFVGANLRQTVPEMHILGAIRIAKGQPATNARTAPAIYAGDSNRKRNAAQKRAAFAPALCRLRKKLKPADTTIENAACAVGHALQTAGIQ